MKFGVLLPHGWRLDLVDIPETDHWRLISNRAIQAEAAGFDSVWVNDHFLTVPIPTQEATYEAWSLMAALAATTTRVELGQMCTSVGYRNPAYLAKMAVTVDMISGGRLNLGIGAGWYELEYRAYGYPFPSAGTRIAQLEEAVEIMRRLWTEDSVTHQGEHFQLDNAICSPQGTSKLPVWIAGGGEQKTLAVAARLADWTNFGTSLEEFRRKDAVLRSHAEAADRDPDDIGRSTNFFVFCAKSEAEARARRDESLERIRDNSGIGMEHPMVGRWMSLAATPGELVDLLSDWAEAGLHHAIVNFPDLAYDPAGMELFAECVLNQLSPTDAT